MGGYLGMADASKKYFEKDLASFMSSGYVVPMQIEVRPCQLAFGYNRQNWPKTRHHICRIGNREVRLIIALDENPSILGVVAIIAASFLLP